MGRVVIACYRPKPGRTGDLVELTRGHVPLLREEGLVTTRRPVLLAAEDGTVLEIFEWRSKEAMEEAHGNARVLELWDRYARVCDFVPVGSLDEAGNLFSEFTPLDG
jgi:hypothetical protein